MKKLLIVLFVTVLAISTFSFTAQLSVPDLSTVKGEFGITTDFNSGIDGLAGAEFVFLNGTFGSDFVFSVGFGPMIANDIGAKLSLKAGTWGTKGYLSVDTDKGLQVGGMQRFWNGYFKAGFYINKFELFLGLEY